MNSLVINIFIVLFYLRTLTNVTANEAVVELGSSSCNYFGRTDSSGDQCRKDAVKIRKLPTDCSSYIYDGFVFNANLEIVLDPSDSTLGTLDDLIGSNKPVFVYLGHESLIAWHEAFKSPRKNEELDKLGQFARDHPVTGFILKHISFQDTQNLDINNYRDFSSNLLSYMQAISAMNYQVGLFINAKDLMNPNMSLDKLLDFNKLNEGINYYMIGFDEFNECNEDLINGTIPMSTASPEYNTLSNLVQALNQLAIPKDKLYFEFLVKPSVSKYTLETKNYKSCEISYNEFCENREYQEFWCADTTDTFYEKGLFTDMYGNGFAAKYIDLTDRDNNCECGEDQYITFHMILNGFNVMDEKINCDKIDGI